MVSEEEWEEINEQQWKTTGSLSWREYGWQNIARYFITPAQQKSSGENCIYMRGMTTWMVGKYVLICSILNLVFNCEF